jgi:hypothetical protein
VEDGERPFFAYVAYNAPHYPMHAPREYLDRFPDLDPERRIVAAMIAAVDDGVGAITGTLERTGVADETPRSSSRTWGETPPKRGTWRPGVRRSPSGSRPRSAPGRPGREASSRRATATR